MNSKALCLLILFVAAATTVQGVETEESCRTKYITAIHKANATEDYSIYTQLAKKYVACLDSVYGRKLLTSLSAEDNCDTAFGLAVGATQQFGVDMKVLRSAREACMLG